MREHDISGIVGKLRRSLLDHLQGDMDCHFLADAAAAFEAEGCPDDLALSFIINEDSRRTAASLLRVALIERQLQIDTERALDDANEIAKFAGLI